MKKNIFLTKRVVVYLGLLFFSVLFAGCSPQQKKGVGQAYYNSYSGGAAARLKSINKIISTVGDEVDGKEKVNEKLSLLDWKSDFLEKYELPSDRASVYYIQNLKEGSLLCSVRGEYDELDTKNKDMVQGVVGEEFSGDTAMQEKRLTVISLDWQSLLGESFKPEDYRFEKVNLSIQEILKKPEPRLNWVEVASLEDLTDSSWLPSVGEGLAHQLEEKREAAIPVFCKEKKSYLRCDQGCEKFYLALTCYRGDSLDQNSVVDSSKEEILDEKGQDSGFWALIFLEGRWDKAKDEVHFFKNFSKESVPCSSH